MKYIKFDDYGERLELRTIDLLRFPMAILILLLHSSFLYEIKDGTSIFEGWNVPAYHMLDFILVDNITNIAVPLFS